MKRLLFTVLALLMLPTVLPAQTEIGTSLKFNYDMAEVGGWDVVTPQSVYLKVPIKPIGYLHTEFSFAYSNLDDESEEVRGEDAISVGLQTRFEYQFMGYDGSPFIYFLAGVEHSDYGPGLEGNGILNWPLGVGAGYRAVMLDWLAVTLRGGYVYLAGDKQDDAFHGAIEFGFLPGG